MRACAESHVEIVVDLRFINDCNEPQPKCQFGTIDKFSSVAFFLGGGRSFLHPNLKAYLLRNDRLFKLS